MPIFTVRIPVYAQGLPAGKVDVGFKSAPARHTDLVRLAMTSVRILLDMAIDAKHYTTVICSELDACPVATISITCVRSVLDIVTQRLEIWCSDQELSSLVLDTGSSA